MEVACWMIKTMFDAWYPLMTRDPSLQFCQVLCRFSTQIYICPGQVEVSASPATFSSLISCQADPLVFI